MNHDKEMTVDELVDRTRAITCEDFEKIFKKLVEDGSPNKDGSCKNEGCTGRVVKRVNGLSSIGYHYSHPECNECGRIYIYTGYIFIPVVGMKEFNEMMNKPFTI